MKHQSIGGFMRTKKSIGIITIFTLLLVISNISFSVVTIENIIQKISQQNDTIKDIKGTITTTTAFMGKEIKQSATIFQKKPNKFKIVYGDGKQIISCDGIYVYMKTSFNDEIIKKEVGENTNASQYQLNPMLSLPSILESYNCVISLEGENLYKLTLSPKDESTINHVSEIWVDYENLLIKKMISETETGKSIIEVTNYMKYENTYFPTIILNKCIVGGKTMEIKIEWAEVLINSNLSDSLFVIK